MNRKLTSLRAKLLAGLLPLFIGSFLVFFGITYYMASSVLYQDADNIAAEVGRTTALSVEQDFAKKEDALKWLATNEGIRTGSHEQRVAILNEVQQRTNNGFAMVAYMDLNGQAYNEKDKAMDRASRDYFKNVKATQKPYITGPSVSGTSGKLITIICYPVMTQGQLTGMVYGTVELDSISDFTANIKYMETGRVYIADEQGLTIAYGLDPERVGKMDLTKEEQDGYKLDPALVKAFNDAVSSDKQTHAEYSTSRGTESKAILTPIHLGERTWIAVSTAPISEIRANAISMVKILAIVALLMLAAISVVIWVVSKKMCDPVVALRAEADLLNSGDLRSRPMESADRSDEIGDLARGFKQMRGTLRGLLQNIAANAEKVSAAAEELTAASHQSAAAANQVAESITDMAGGMAKQSDAAGTVSDESDKIAEKTGNVSMNAEAIAAVTQMTADSVKDGRDAIRTVVGNMDAINAGTTTVQQTIDKLAKSSDEISNIVGMISGIAEQTNLLALNAAIEAARAGEAGRGFSVVADEVRKLAEESANSTQKIADLVAVIQNDMKGAVEASTTSAESVASSMESVKKADSVFESIQISVESLAGGVSDVASSIKEIADGSKEMSEAAKSINDIAKHNADQAESVSSTTEEQSASAQEIAAATRSLAEEAEKLAGEMDRFKM